MQAKTYLIIGGSKGIGRALTEKITGKGHKAIIISRSNEDISALPNIDFYKADVKSGLPDLKETIDGLAYCPGTINLKPFKSLKLSDFKEDFEINFLGAVKAINKYLPNLKKSEASSILIFSTVAVQMGLPYHSSISASKGAIEGLARSLASEFAPAIRVNAIAPSLTETNLSQNLLRTEQSRKASNERHPLKRIGQPTDIANAAWFLLSEESSWITGQIIHVDGGLSSIKNS